MGFVEQSGGGRSVNAEVNIVPFIDLMSVCIIFLLLTAVWTQVSMIQLGASIHGRRTEAGPITPSDKPQVKLNLWVRPYGYDVVIGGSVVRIPKNEAGDFDQRL